MESIAADIEDYYGDKRDVDEVSKYQAFQNKVQMTFLPNFVRTKKLCFDLEQMFRLVLGHVQHYFSYIMAIAWVSYMYH